MAPLEISFSERVDLLADFVKQITSENRTQMQGYTVKEEIDDYTQVELNPEEFPNVTLTWLEDQDGRIVKTGAYCTGYEFPFIAFPPPTLLLEQG